MAISHIRPNDFTQIKNPFCVGLNPLQAKIHLLVIVIFGFLTFCLYSLYYFRKKEKIQQIDQIINHDKKETGKMNQIAEVVIKKGNEKKIALPAPMSEQEKLEESWSKEKMKCLKEGKVLELTNQSFEYILEKQDGSIVFLEFYTTWWKHSLQVRQIIDHLAQHHQIKGKIVVARSKLDIDPGEADANENSEENIPKYVIYKNGEIIKVDKLLRLIQTSYVPLSVEELVDLIKKNT